MVKKAGMQTGLLLVVMLGVLLAPTSVHGQVTYATTSGTSMAPEFHTGDLVLLRKAGRVGVGDIAGYRSGATGQVVVHRVIAEEGGRLTFKGDNNWWVDSYQPTQDEVVGKLWIHVEGGGRHLAAVDPRWVFGALGGVVGMTLVVPGGERKRSRGRRRTALAQAQFAGDIAQAILVSLLIVAALAGAVAVAAFRTPEETATHRDVAARHSGIFSYGGAALPGPVYADAVVRTGDPIYVNLVPKVTVTFAYNLDVPGAEDVRGTVRLFAVTRDITGWEQSADLVPATPFEGTQATVSTDVDVEALMVLAGDVQEATGGSVRYFTSAVTAEVVVTGTVDGQPFHAPFQPFVTLRVTPPNEIFVETSMTRDFESVPPLHGNQEGTAFFPVQDLTIAVPDRADATLGLIVADVSVSRARAVAGAVALVAAAAALLLMGLMAWALRLPAARIQARYGRRLIRVAAIAPPANAIAVKSLDDLVRVADRYQSMVLWEHHRDRDVFCLQEEALTLVYAEGTGGDP
jgi:signal peptidase I